MSQLYLLDTNILVHSVRGDEVWSRLQRKYSLLLIEPRPSICIVTDGEIRSLALQFHWQKSRSTQMEFLLGYFERVNIDRRQILESYATIDAHAIKIGRKMGKNDIWIAAAARSIGARLLTTDGDFNLLHPDFVDVDRFDLTSPIT